MKKITKNILNNKLTLEEKSFLKKMLDEKAVFAFKLSRFGTFFDLIKTSVRMHRTINALRFKHMRNSAVADLIMLDNACKDADKIMRDALKNIHTNIRKKSQKRAEQENKPQKEEGFDEEDIKAIFND